MEDEVIIQPELRWVARPNVKVVVKAFGMKLSAHVSAVALCHLCTVTLQLWVSGYSDTKGRCLSLDCS